MIKLGEEGRSKAKMGWKLGLLHHQTVSQVVYAKEKFLKEIKSEHMKQPYCWYGESFSGLDRRSKQPQHFLKPKLNPKQGPNSLELYEG